MKKQTLTLIDRIELPDEKMIAVLQAMTPAKRLLSTLPVSPEK